MNKRSQRVLTREERKLQRVADLIWGIISLILTIIVLGLVGIAIYSNLGI